VNVHRRIAGKERDDSADVFECAHTPGRDPRASPPAPQLGRSTLLTQVKCGCRSLLGVRGDRGEVANNDELLHPTDLLREKGTQ
jgi:hypothetical protein